MVMMMISPRGGYPHEKSSGCEYMKCRPTGIDSEKAAEREEKPVAPEFTIETRYLTGKIGVPKPGWTYTFKWTSTSPTGVERLQIRAGYGHDTEADARSAAESHATEIAKAALPVNTYKFTPDI